MKVNIENEIRDRLDGFTAKVKQVARAIADSAKPTAETTITQANKLKDKIIYFVNDVRRK